jgi:hypothetical protein
MSFVISDDSLNTILSQMTIEMKAYTLQYNPDGTPDDSPNVNLDINPNDIQDNNFDGIRK